MAPEPEPARDGDASSALGGVACDTNHASTTCRVAFLSTIAVYLIKYFQDSNNFKTSKNGCLVRVIMRFKR